MKWLYHYFTLSLITLITTFYFFTYITFHLHPFHNSHTQAEHIPHFLLYPTPWNILLYSSEFYTSSKLLLRQYISSILSLVVLTFGIVFSFSNISLWIDSWVGPFTIIYHKWSRQAWGHSRWSFLRQETFEHMFSMLTHLFNIWCSEDHKQSGTWPSLRCRGNWWADLSILIWQLYLHGWELVMVVEDMRKGEWGW